MQTIPRFFDHSKGSYFIFGPRGTGKSTWLRNRYADAAWIDLLDTALERSYSARPERLKEFINANRDKKIIVIDEVQRVPQLLSLVHLLIEADKSLHFVLTGSSARKIKQSGVDLLAGRAILRTMHPFMAAEMGPLFNLEESLRLGMVPLVRMADAPLNSLRSYIDLYLQQEIKTERIVRKVDEFNRFLESISFSHAQLINLAAISRECAASRTTVESYVSILEDLLLGIRLPVFSRRAQRALVSHAKFYFFDCGVFRSLRPSGPIDIREEIEGPSLEGLVFQHLRAWIDYRGADLKIHFWRTLAGNEVDFILYGGEGFHAIEVKNSASIRPVDLHGLKAFKTDFPESTTLLLYRGEETIERNGIRCMPVDHFLKILNPQSPLPG
jgi:predicted AAA+ superfamily ATPase